MTREEAIEILTKELKCNSLDECDLKCDECGMCTNSKDLMEAYGMAIIALARPKGKWLPSDIPDSILSKCSNCGFDTGAWSFNYCPMCGAKMEVENG